MFGVPVRTRHGETVPDRAEARIVFAEVYPSMFHVREEIRTDVHDRLQVITAARAFALRDREGTLGASFAAPPTSESVLHEGGWVLGAG